MIQRVLVPTDFSKAAGRAVDTAAKLCARLRAELYLLHSLHMELDLGESLPGLEELERAARASLDGLKLRIAAEGLECHAEMAPGPPWQAIRESAQSVDADLIVMGTRGLTGLDHVLFGSVAERTLRTAPCPVISVGEGSQREFALKTIIVAMDFSDCSRCALDHAKELAKQAGPAQLVLVHAQYVPADIEYLFAEQGTPLPRPSLGAVSDQLAQLLTELQDEGLACEYFAEPGNPEHTIVDVAKSTNADLIAMGTHGRTGLSHFFLGSVSERVVRSAPCPVLTARPATEGESR